MAASLKSQLAQAISQSPEEEVEAKIKLILKTIDILPFGRRRATFECSSPEIAAMVSERLASIGILSRSVPESDKIEIDIKQFRRQPDDTSPRRFRTYVFHCGPQRLAVDFREYLKEFGIEAFMPIQHVTIREGWKVIFQLETKVESAEVVVFKLSGSNIHGFKYTAEFDDKKEARIIRTELTPTGLLNLTPSFQKYTINVTFP